MIGLRCDTPEDLSAIVRLSWKILEMLKGFGRSRGSMGSLTVSVSTFVPKPWTSFQFAGFAPVAELRQKRKIFEKGLRGLPNLRLRLDSLDKAMLQAILSRGDRELSKGLILPASKGLGIRKVLKVMGTNVDRYLRKRSEDEIFPWEILQHRVKREFLSSQWRRARDSA